MIGGGLTGFGMGFGFLGLFIMLLFWGGLIALAIWLVKAILSGNQPSGGNSPSNTASAREILDLRYAQGELTREEYETIKGDLQ